VTTVDVTFGKTAFRVPVALWNALVPAGIFLLAFSGYYLSMHLLNPLTNGDFDLRAPADWYKHYIYLAEAMLHGTLNLKDTGLPDFYQDVVREQDGDIYLPYQPMPGVLAMPFVAIWGTAMHEWLLSMIVGAVNVVLFWYILRLMGVSRTTKLLLIPFFAFGTANFYSASTGTLWFYNHVVAVMFVLLAITFMLRRTSPFVPAICLGAAALSRQPTALAVPFFLYWMAAQQHNMTYDFSELWRALRQLEIRRLLALLWEPLGSASRDRQTLFKLSLFVGTLVPFGLISLWYNAARFGGIFDTGLDEVYLQYGDRERAGVLYTIYLEQVADAKRFAEFDLRNIPLHLYTIFALPPKFIGDGSMFRPSEYGMSALLTSSPFIFAALTRRSNPLRIASWIAIPLVAIPTLMYYSQGWVQFGYRYLMDYLPFIMILVALGFDDNQSRKAFWWKVALVAVSIVIGFWGRYWGTRLGW